MPAVHGDSHNRSHSVSHGVSRGDPLASVTRDATSLIYYPATTAEWTTFLSVKGLSGTVSVPNLLWNLQEASGNFVDAVGTFTGTASGAAFGYQQSLAGSSRKGITTNLASTSVATNTDAGLPDILTNSLTCLNIGAVTGAASVRVWEALGTTTRALFRHNTTPVVQIVDNASVAAGAAPTATLTPFILKFNRTGAVCTGYDATTKMTPTFDVTTTGKSYQMFGDGTIRSPTATWLYNCGWFNAAAEMSDATIKALLQAMGFSIAWT